jgi:hypothetical protein
VREVESEKQGTLAAVAYCCSLSSSLFIILCVLSLLIASSTRVAAFSLRFCVRAVVAAVAVIVVCFRASAATVIEGARAGHEAVRVRVRVALALALAHCSLLACSLLAMHDEWIDGGSGIVVQYCMLSITMRILYCTIITASYHLGCSGCLPSQQNMGLIFMLSHQLSTRPTVDIRHCIKVLPCGDALTAEE